MAVNLALLMSLVTKNEILWAVDSLEECFKGVGGGSCCSWLQLGAYCFIVFSSVNLLCDDFQLNHTMKCQLDVYTTITTTAH